ncbi:MAG: adenosine-specific kinase [Terriglobia bacterium]
MDLKAIRLSFPEGCNIILGQSHFIKTVEDLYEILVAAVPGIQFGIAFNEASGPCLVRHQGNSPELLHSAIENLRQVGAGHTFLIVLKNAFPINVLQAVRQCQEVCSIYCATANPVEVIVAETDQGRGILGVVDGSSPKGIEGEEDQIRRKEMLRKFGYKL